jgi:hypothetical protein
LEKELGKGKNFVLAGLRQGIKAKPPTIKDNGQKGKARKYALTGVTNEQGDLDL